MTLLRIILTLVLLLLLSFTGGYFFYQYELEKPLAFSDKSLVIDIHKGDSLNKVLGKLQGLGLIKTVWSAKLYARENALANKVKVGEFQLNKAKNIQGILKLITSNSQIQYQIRFIEGHTFKQIRAVLSGNKKLKLLLNEKSEKELIKILDFKPPIRHLEGEFYPDTYLFVKGDSDVSILKRAHLRLKKILNEEWLLRQKDIPISSAYEALILASIVEKETGVPLERSQIAGVFIRRLEKKMRLQTDPTVIYGLGDAYKGNLKRKHLKQYSPYNTYQIKGLPPTPIAMVGKAAIHAVLHPAEGSALYFVAKGDGSHAFSATIKAHNKAVRKYQLKRRSDYSSVRAIEKKQKNITEKLISNELKAGAQ